jgi:tetratricopeptide (TPR) repeat protein
LHLLGLVRAQAGAPEEGVELMARAVAVQPDFALAHYNLGNALRRLGRAEAAARAYGEAIRLKPNSPGALVNLGVTLRGLGRHAQALDAYARALAYQPNDPQIHYNTGVALQELGRLEDAARAYRRAVAMQPDHVDAWANLAAALLSLGQGTEALECCRRRVALEPNAAEAHTALAATWLELGWPEEAAAASRRALALAPEDAVAHAHLGGALRELGQGATALAAYERAVALRPDAAEGWVNLAISLQEAGRADEAKAAVARALALEPGSGAAWSVHGDLKTFARGDPDLNALTALLASADTTGASQEDRLDLEFTLAKALMDMGEANEAFVRLNAANGRKRAALSYDVSEDAREFAAIAGALDGPRLARPMDGGDPSDLAVFIIGMPRSGTTLVEQILASHPQVHGAGELPTLESILIARLGPSLSPTARAQRLAELGPADLTAMGSAYVRKLAELGPGAVRVTDKMPSNFRWAGLIRLMLPNARIIHCRRDPIDTCLSCYSRNFSRGQAFAYDLRDLGLYYRAYYALMDHWRGLLPADRFLEVRYEAVVADLESEARRLIAFCGLDWDAACLAFDQTRRPVRTASVNQVRKPLYRSSVARWKAYEAHLGPLLHALGGAPIP